MRSRPVLAAAAAVAVGLAVHRLGGRSGANSEEVREPLPGDELVRGPLWVSTRAITVDAPAAEVWPWIVQMGFPAYRGGWYTPYWLDRLQWGIRARSADEIRPDLQQLEVGDRVPDSIDGSVFFTVAGIEPGHALVLHSTRHLLKPMRAIDFSWAFVLEPVTAHETRLLMRARTRCEPRYAWTLLGSLIGLGDFLNASVMLRGIKRRSEGVSTARVEDGENGAPCRPGAAIGRSTELSAREFALAEVFFGHPGQVLSRAQLLDHAWGYDFTRARTSWTSMSATCARSSAATASVPSVGWDASSKLAARPERRRRADAQHTAVTPDSRHGLRSDGSR